MQGAGGSPGNSTVQKPPANAGDTGSILGSGRSPGVGNGNALQYSCLKIPWTEEPGGPQSMESQRVRHTRARQMADLNQRLDTILVDPMSQRLV